MLKIEKPRGEGKKNHPKAHKYDMSGILLSQRLSRKRYDQYVNSSLRRPEVRAFSLYANYIVTVSRSPVPKIIGVIFIIQLVIQLKRLESMDLEKIILAQFSV